MRPWFIARASLSWLFFIQSTRTTHITVNKAAKHVIRTVVNEGTPEIDVGHGVCSGVVAFAEVASSSLRMISHDAKTAKRKAIILIVLPQKTDKLFHPKPIVN